LTSILQFSDIHFGVEDRNAMEAVHEFAQSLKPDVTLICGDITQSGKIEEFENAKVWIERFPGPRIITPGNHDTPMFNIWLRVFVPFGRYHKYLAPLSDDRYVDDNIAIIPMNTARGVQAKLDWSLGVMNMPKLQETLDELKMIGKNRLKMIAVHHPLIYPPVSPLQKETKNGEAATTLISNSDIDGVLSGHVHAPFVVGREPGQSKLLSIGSGTLSTRSRGKPASFNHIVITETDISVTAIDWTGKEFLAQPPWVYERITLQA